MEQLLPIFDEEQFNPTLDRIEEAFSVENVTKDFFDIYKEKFLELKEYLDTNEDFTKEAQEHKFTSEQFAKKLMGQLAFLYFLQKKGWLGVLCVKTVITTKEYDNLFYSSNAAKAIIPKIYEKVREDEYRIKVSLLVSSEFTNEEADVLASAFTTGKFDVQRWGEGSKTFVRDLFTSCQKTKSKAFFNNYLEPLFYEALNHKRGQNSYYKRFNCKVPFLNGGLFEPLKNYDWKYTNFNIPDEIFSNINEKGIREADGILDIFDRYNFTMNEDEPLEREVAVDPEMLGKIFENLLDVSDRKSKGAFYTPREIVHYMCQESIINYLVNEIDAPYEDIKQFVLYGEIMKDEDCSIRTLQGEKKRTIPDSVYEKLMKIDNALANIRVADPAVGSGAFPLGILSEIVKTRDNITYYYAAMLNSNEEKRRKHEERSLYNLKWNTIKNSIYAVDIEASAVDIAKLRLWLSLVIDVDLEPTIDDAMMGNKKQKEPRTLPNLEYNIMCGNSLVDEYEGIQFFDKKLLNPDSNDFKGIQMELFAEDMGNYIDELFKQQEVLFGEQNPEHKKEMKEEINKIIDNIIVSKLSRYNEQTAIKKYNECRSMGEKPFFIWELEFGRVFKEKGGFDIVMGNPPYLRIQGIQQVNAELAELYKKKFVSATGSFDLYVLFVEKGLQLCNQVGLVNYIMPHKWVNSAFGKGLRGELSAKKAMRKMISFGSYQVFNASTYTALIWVSRNENKKVRYFEFDYDIENNRQLQGALYNLQSEDYAQISSDALESDNWVLTSNKIDKVISKLKEQPYTIKDIFKKIFQGIATSKDSVYFLKNAYEKDGMVHGFSDELVKDIVIESGLAKPLLKGYQVHQYMTGKTDNYVIVPYKLCGDSDDKKALLYTEAELNELFPLGYEYLKECEETLRQRERGKLLNDEYWYRYIYPKNLNLFENEKILTPEISLGTNMMYDAGVFYHNTKVYSLVKKDEFPLSYKFYLALLNSNVMWFFLKNTGYVLRGGYYTFKTNYLEPFPLPDVKDKEVVTNIEQLVDKAMLNVKEEMDNKEISRKLNEIIYCLYGLSSEEIAFIEA